MNDPAVRVDLAVNAASSPDGLKTWTPTPCSGKYPVTDAGELVDRHRAQGKVGFALLPRAELNWRCRSNVGNARIIYQRKAGLWFLVRGQKLGALHCSAPPPDSRCRASGWESGTGHLHRSPSCLAAPNAFGLRARSGRSAAPEHARSAAQAVSRAAVNCAVGRELQHHRPAVGADGDPGPRRAEPPARFHSRVSGR